MSSNVCSVFVIVISPKCINAWEWVVDNLEGRNGGGGGEGGCKNCDWNELNEGGGGRRGCGGEIKLLNGGGDEAGDIPLLLLLLF